MGSKRKRNNAPSGSTDKPQTKKPKSLKPIIDASELTSDPVDPPPADAEVDSDAEETPDSGDETPATTTTVLRPFGGGTVDLKKPTEQLDITDRIGEALLYDRLGHEDGAVRSAAALRILRGLLGEEKDGERTAGVSEAELTRHLEKRLFAGLASGRNASRVGLSLVLTEMLSQLFGKENQALASAYPSLTYDIFLTHLRNLNETIGNVPGQQERDVLFGQLFGIECFVHAHILTPKEADRWFSLLNLLLKLSDRKVWMRPQCGWIIAQALPQLSNSQVQSTLERLAKEGLAKTPEALGLWLLARKQIPELAVKPWENPFSAKGLSDMAAVLKETINDDGGEVHETRRVKVPNANSQVHFAWDLLAEHYHDIGASGSREFNSFWVRVVDDGLFSKTASNGQKLRGFLVFQKLLRFFAKIPELLTLLFSRNLLACLMNQAAKEDRFLHIAAQRALKSISDLATDDPSTVPVIIRALTGNQGSFAFDARTNSKTVEKTLQNTEAVSAAEMVALLKERLQATTGPDSPDSTAHLHAYVEYLYKLMDSSEKPANKEAGEATSAAALAIKELALLSYAKGEEMEKLGMNEKTKDLCRTRLEAAFAKLSRRTEDMTYLGHAVLAIEPERFDLDPRIATELTTARDELSALLSPDKSAEPSSPTHHGLALLYAVSILQVYNEDGDALNMLADLKQYQTVFQRAQEEAAGSDTEGGEDPVFGLFVEILLSMVARPSSLTRQVAKQVFEVFSGYLTPNALKGLLEVLETSEDLEGQKKLFEGEDEMELEEIVDGEEDDDVVDLDDMSIDGDEDLLAKITNVNAPEAAAASDSDSDSSASDSDSESEAEDDGEDHAAFDAKLASLLRTHRATSVASSASSLSSMDSNQMLALDESISAAFKSLQSRTTARPRKTLAAAKEATVSLKNRVLDLLTIYLRVHPLSPATFHILPALVSLVASTGNKPLASRAVEAILVLQKTIRKIPGGSADYDALSLELLAAQLRAIHEAVGAARNNSNQFSKAASTASLVVAGIMWAMDKESAETIVMEYGVLQTSWLMGRVIVHTSFFTNWVNWCQSRAVNK